MGPREYVCGVVKDKVQGCQLTSLPSAISLPLPAVARSVAKTGRCVIVHEAPVTAGAGAEIAASLQQSCFLNLEAPICRIGGFDTAFPHVHEVGMKQPCLQSTP